RDLEGGAERLGPGGDGFPVRGGDVGGGDDIGAGGNREGAGGEVVAGVTRVDTAGRDQGHTGEGAVEVLEVLRAQLVGREDLHGVGAERERRHHLGGREGAEDDRDAGAAGGLGDGGRLRALAGSDEELRAGVD